MQYGPRRPVPTKLDPYKAIIETRLTAFPALSAVRLFEEIRAAGYTGGYSQLKEAVRQLRPVPPPEAVVRFETPAGRQGQVDFAEFRFPWGKRYALLVVLGYSRVLWCRFSPRQDMRTLLTGLEEAFLAFGVLDMFCLLFACWLDWAVPVLLFCQCGSDRVDIKLWNARRAQLQCLTCGQEAWLEGFTVSDFDPAKLLTAAVVDQARRHRKRPPEEISRIEEHRKTRPR